MSEAYGALNGLIKNKSNISDAKQFQDIVNVVFHDYESKHYDNIHEEMWKSLPQQFDLLINDIWPLVSDSKTLKLLDVGCGTGLATEFLLGTPMNQKIADIHLLDTSTLMLEKAKKRAKKWGKNFKLIHGDILQASDTYDVIIISSVLHHIPDLPGFLETITSIQKPGGILLTMHDPATESVRSETYKARCKEYDIYHETHKQKRPIFTRIKDRLTNIFAPVDYIQKVNQKLLSDKVIHQPLTPTELWSVTDVHVEGLPYALSDGITKQLLKDNLPQYSLASYRTYGFYGTLYSNLDKLYKSLEKDLIEQKDQHGRNFSSAWIKQTTNY